MTRVVHQVAGFCFTGIDGVGAADLITTDAWQFETCLAAEARRHQADGVVCGHIHHAAFREIDGLTYINTGDWVESCTAVIEHHDGRFEMIRWPQGRLKGQAAVPIVVPARPAPVPALVEAA